LPASGQFINTDGNIGSPLVMANTTDPVWGVIILLSVGLIGTAYIIYRVIAYAYSELNQDLDKPTNSD